MFRKKNSEDGSNNKEKEDKNANKKEKLANLVDQKLQEVKTSLHQDIVEQVTQSDLVTI